MGVSRRDLRHDADRFARGQNAVHAGRADADALLAAAHAHSVEFGAVQQLAEDEGNLLFQDARPVVLHGDFEAVRPGFFHADPDFREDAGFFAGVKRVVDGFFDGGENRFARVVETEQVPVLGKKLTNGNVLLFGSHALGCRSAWFTRGFV